MEEDLNFRTLFLRNLHPAVSHYLGIMACPCTMTMQQLRDFTHKAYCKQKTASEKTGRLPTIYPVSDHRSEWTLEGAQHALVKSALSSEQNSEVTSESAEILRILKELLQQRLRKEDEENRKVPRPKQRQTILTLTLSWRKQRLKTIRDHLRFDHHDSTDLCPTMSTHEPRCPKRGDL